jgi:hypothetical protein
MTSGDNWWCLASGHEPSLLITRQVHLPLDGEQP